MQAQSCIAISAMAPFTTGREQRLEEITLMHSPLMHDNTFDLWVGPEHDRVIWTLPLTILRDALSTPDAQLDLAEVTIMATGGRVVFNLPVDEQFPQLILDAALVTRFIEDVSRMVVATRSDGTILVSLAEKRGLRAA